MTTRPSFSIVTEEPEAEQPPAPDHAAAMQMILLGISTLSKRAVLAIAEYLWAAAIASAFWLWLSIPSPNTNQLIPSRR